MTKQTDKMNKQQNEVSTRHIKISGKTAYPTEWAYGLPRGYILDRGTNYMIGVQNPKTKKKETFCFSIKDYDSKEECLKATIKERDKISHNWGITRNEIRYIDEDTIEVQLTQGRHLLQMLKI